MGLMVATSQEFFHPHYEPRIQSAPLPSIRAEDELLWDGSGLTDISLSHVFGLKSACRLEVSPISKGFLFPTIGEMLKMTTRHHLHNDDQR